ncbi:LURP-one-like protein [Melia azedarach]|uniref:LURP-one-like protein n=3 Tax=Melia azedarach TaxID=155640 RepID=A0ACC1WZI1_MELAZ|nr:LURP-one-like protein [Melia azedarach]KAJ4704307.1 LURP-one-like protein [Melia azedarach]KAJ4704309.1 LURP-one-like protein [Melia azedarach]
MEHPIPQQPDPQYIPDQPVPHQPIPQHIPQQIPQQPIPAPTPAHTIYSNPVMVIGAQYCLPYPVDLAVVRKFWALTDGSFAVTDINGTVLFKVKDKLLSLHDKRKILDPAGNPLVTVSEKVFSLHEKHFAFRGDSTDPKDLLFTVQQSSAIQLKTTLNVYLANNTKQEVCDFKVKGSWTERSCIVYAGETNTIVAQMHKKTTIGSVLLDKDKFMVTVYPNIDYAFIVALIVILDDINGNDSDD